MTQCVELEVVVPLVVNDTFAVIVGGAIYSSIFIVGLITAALTVSVVSNNL